MKLKNLRTIVAAVVFAVLSIGLIAGINIGTLSGFGWDTVSALCPLGAFTTMIATKTIVPRAVISIVIMAILVFFVGRAFCGWICPIPLFRRAGRSLRSAKARKEQEESRSEQLAAIAKADSSVAAKEGAHDCASCGACKQPHQALDSRHYVLGGALLSTAIFGFPVFCLVCPVGLSFATVLLVWRLFSAGDLTIQVVLIPLLLVIELVFLRKWCTRFCPLSALMNLVSRFSRTLQPTIDEAKCIESRTGNVCSKCASACDFDINLRHLAYGERTLDDCTRCRACVEACPTHAISMPLVAKAKPGETMPVEISEEEAKAS